MTALRKFPFLPEFHAKLLDGTKTATARSKRYGLPGERLQTPACVVVIDSVEEIPLRYCLHGVAPGGFCWRCDPPPTIKEVPG